MSFDTSGRARAALLVALAAILGACQGGDGVVRPPAVATVAISGASDTITVGDRRALVALVADARGAALAGRRVTWTSSDAAIATVDSAGGVSAIAPGRAVVAAESEGVRSEVAVVVRRRPVVGLSFDRPADTLWLGRSRTVRAQPLAADGSTLADRAVSWVSSDTSLVGIVASPDGSVLARAVGVGATRLIARSEGVETYLSVVVVAVPIGLVDLLAPDTVLVGRTATLRARAWATDGTPLGAADLAGRDVTWTSDRAGVLAVTGIADDVARTGSGLSATAQAAAEGNATITASVGGKSARYTIIAARPRVVRLSFPTPTLALEEGESRTLAAHAVDADGRTVAGAPIAYSLASGANVVRLTPVTAADGTPSVRLDALAPGSATVAVAADGRTATIAVTVAIPAARLRVYPTSITTVPEAHGRLTVTFVDGAGNPQQTGAVTYRTSNPSVVNVDDLGRITTGATGNASLSVTASGATVTVPVTVMTRPASAFQIVVRPIGNVDPAIVDAAQRAADRWERVIVGALPAARVDLDAGQCTTDTPAVHEVVTSLVVFLKSYSIDGSRGTLAMAGPCTMREAALGGLPLVGVMTVDADDVPLLTGATGALADDVMAHELGHVLGIGTTWYGEIPGGALVRSTAGDPRFYGAAAIGGMGRLGIALGADGVPVEDTGGPGTAGGHWRERTFSGELMTGWINPAPNPLSIVTVLSLRDLGYQVTESGADIVSPLSIAGGGAYASTLPPANRGPLANRSPGITGPIQLGERLLRPTFVAGRNGTRRLGPADKQ